MNRTLYRVLAAVVFGLLGAGLGKVCMPAQPTPSDEVMPTAVALVMGAVAFTVCRPRRRERNVNVTVVHVHRDAPKRIVIHKKVGR